MRQRPRTVETPTKRLRIRLVNRHGSMHRLLHSTLPREGESISYGLTYGDVRTRSKKTTPYTRAEYTAFIDDLENQSRIHEIGHAYQFVFHHERGFRLSPNGDLGDFEEQILRHLGFGAKSSEYDEMNQDDVKGMRTSKLKPPHEHSWGYGNMVNEIAIHFNSRKSFLRAVIRMYHDPKMKRVLHALNQSEKMKPWERKKWDAEIYQFFRDYLSRFPQRPEHATQFPRSPNKRF